MFDIIDLSNIDKKVYHIGNLDQKIISLLQLNVIEGKILLDADRLKYIEKHKTDFPSEDAYKAHVEKIPEIIQKPDYLCLHPDGTSIKFFKKFDENIIVAIRLSKKDLYCVKTFYPITESKFKAYIDSGALKKLE